MRRNLIVFCVLCGSINCAYAVECQTSMQRGDSHWTWRLIDGRRCWYKGERGMEKSLLHWPAAHMSANKLEVTLHEPKEEKALAVPEVQPIPSELLPSLPSRPSFEDRWRLR
jgi:hypothetical protein